MYTVRAYASGTGVVLEKDRILFLSGYDKPSELITIPERTLISLVVKWGYQVPPKTIRMKNPDEWPRKWPRLGDSPR